MPVMNIMEDIVSSIIDRVIAEDRSIANVAEFKHDIEAYVLNRIPPKYVTSERGILHAKLESKFFVQQKTDMLLLIHEAIDIIAKRRMIPSSNFDEIIKKKKIFSPHLIGEVLEETTFSVIPDVQVTLLYKGKPAAMIDSTWANPYMTSVSTMGYYHFWPEVDVSEINDGDEAVFEIKFSHPKVKEKIIDFSVTTSTSFDPTISKVIPIALLTVEDGVDISFLYD